MDVAPKVSITGAGGEASGSVIQALMTLLMADRMQLAVEPEKEKVD